MGTEIEYDFIGWCNKVDSDGSKHDKVWTSFKVGTNWYCAWGARGRKLSFKKHGSGWSGENSINKVRRTKEAPVGHYKEVDSFLLFSVFPYFKEDVEKYLMFATLANKIK